MNKIKKYRFHQGTSLLCPNFSLRAQRMAEISPGQTNSENYVPLSVHMSDRRSPLQLRHEDVDVFERKLFIAHQYVYMESKKHQEHQLGNNWGCPESSSARAVESLPFMHGIYLWQMLFSQLSSPFPGPAESSWLVSSNCESSKITQSKVTT